MTIRIWNRNSWKSMTNTTKRQRPTTASLMMKRQWLWVATTAALWQQHQALGFMGVVGPSPSSSHKHQPLTYGAPPVSPLAQPPQARSYHATRHQALLRNDENNNNNQTKDGFLTKVAKSILPKKWFQSEEEQRAEQARKQAQDEISSSMNQMLSGAPLPIRMMGRMITPLMTSALSGMAESLQQQQGQVQSVLSEATMYIQKDVAVTQALGQVQVSTSPMSQSSSTTSINGQSQSRIDLAVAVQGSLGGSGVAQISATDQGIQQIVVQTSMGPSIHVSLLQQQRSTSRFSGSNNNLDDNVVEAEIIEKNTNNPNKDSKR